MPGCTGVPGQLGFGQLVWPDGGVGGGGASVQVPCRQDSWTLAAKLPGMVVRKMDAGQLLMPPVGPAPASYTTCPERLVALALAPQPGDGTHPPCQIRFVVSEHGSVEVSRRLTVILTTCPGA